MSSTKSILGLVRNHVQADAVVGALLNTGFARTDVSTLYLDRAATGELVHGLGLPKPEHTAAAVGIGGVVGAALGLLAGLGMLTIPGFWFFLAGGPIMAAIGGMFAGATAGGVMGVLVGLGISEVEARQYEGKIKGGAILLSIHVDDRDQRGHARKVLEGYGATNIATVGSTYIQQKASPALANA